jgi:hypothetical protein
MNRVGMALKDLYEAEEELADAYVKAGERLGADHELWYHCRRSAEQCHRHADAVRPFARFHEQRLPSADRDTVGETSTGALRHKLSELLGRRPESGLLLLDSLHDLYLQAQDVSFRWIIAIQLAQATRDAELLELANELHAESLVQIRWLETQVKHASPQVLLVGSAS